MFPDERSKSAEITEPGRAAEAFFYVWIKRLIIYIKSETTFVQPFSVFVSQDN